MKKGLHINSYFLTNRIHYIFYKKITAVKNDIFIIPVYKRFRKDNDYTEPRIDFIYNGIDKRVFFTKVFKVLYLFYKKNIKSQSFDYIHAHTLISDGLPSFVLSFFTKKPFIATVRSADVDYFISKSTILKKIGGLVLEKASLVYFVSPSSRKKVKETYPKIRDEKFLLLPNGIDDFWITNRNKKGEVTSFNCLNILFVGQIIDLKRLDILVDFICRYNDRRYTLNVVGRNLNGTNFEVLNKKALDGNKIVYHGEIDDSKTLAKMYASNDVFVMLSNTETFGVVYIEALSQGLPIVYTKNQGIDGYFKDGLVGYSSDQSIEDLKTKLDQLVLNYNTIIKNIPNEIDRFDWADIIGKYIKDVNQRL